jgi:hypothetical protein
MQIINDLINFYRYKKIEKKFTTIFFCENENLYIYLKNYIENKKQKVLLISFENFYNSKYQNKNITFFYFKSNFIKKIFFLTNKVKYFYSTTPELNNSIFRKSVYNKTKYIYIQHSAVSLSMAYTKNAFDEFDVIHVVNKAQKKEVEHLNINKNKKIKIFSSKYVLFNQNTPSNVNLKNKVLIAPTWNTNFYELNLHIILADLLNKNNISFEFRPHYMSYVKNEINDKIFSKHNILVNSDLNLNFNLFENLISDWSGIYFEFAYLKKRKPILINTSKKIRNQNYLDFLLEPIEISARKIIGNEIDVENIHLIENIFLRKDQEDRIQINKYFKNNFFL